MKPKAVIFDIGNVLIRWHPENLYDQLMSKDERRAMFKAIDLHSMNERIDQGENWRDTVYAHAEKFPEYRDMIRLWHDRWAEMATPAIPHSWHLLRQLRAKNIPVFVLSNFGIESFAYAETLYPILSEFDKRFISGHMRVTKPAARIYEMVEEDTGLSGPQILFADDRDENIEAARARNWQTHLFAEPEPFGHQLVELGLLDTNDLANSPS